MTDWAEGSGSTWQDLDGDPRIVPGAEVLVGWRDSNRNINRGEHELGRRRTVERAWPIDEDREMALTLTKNWSWYTRDLVCLRTADGELTEEGRALEHLNAGRSVRPKMRHWLERAGIVIEGLGTDMRRLIMALGREEPRDCAGCHYQGTITDHCHKCQSGHSEWKPRKYETPPVVAPYHSPPALLERLAAPVMCASCGVQPASIHGHCADCAQALDDAAPDYAADDPPDLSGERHLSALRAWVRRPMGTR